MNALFSAMLRGVGYGAFMGLGLGTITGVMGMFNHSTEVSLTFQHPVTGEMVRVETFGLDGDANVLGLLMRAKRSMEFDPSIRPSALRQFIVILARVRNFYLSLKYALADPASVKLRIRARKAATSASQSITNLESHIWDSREIENILGSLAQVQTVIVERALTLDSLQLQK